MKRPGNWWRRIDKLWDGLCALWERGAAWVLRQLGGQARPQKRQARLRCEELEPRLVMSGNPPTAVADSYSAVHGQQLSVSSPGVLGNDTDPENDSLTANLVTGVSHGSLILNGNGSFTYTSASNFTGTDSFTYRAFDGTSPSNTVTVSISVTDTAPVASGDSYTLVGSSLSVSSGSGVLANDSDANSDPLTAVLVSNVSHGSLTLNSNGSFSCTPNSGFSGSDSFTYKANDGAMDSSTVTVTITGHAPVASNDACTLVGASLTVSAGSGVLVNDSDADGGTLLVSLVSNVSHGSLTLNSDGSFGFTPNSGFTGTDSFTYKVGDGFFFSNTATVTITGHAPSASDDSYTLGGSSLTVSAGSGVLANDSDADGGTLSVGLVSGPSHGSLTLNSDGSFTFTPNSGFSGSDSFTYRVGDGFFQSNTATVTISGHAPSASNDSYTLQGASLTVSAAGVLANDSDVDGGTLTASLVNGPAHGSLALNSNGSFTFTPDGTFSGSDSFTYKDSDGFFYSNTATVSISGHAPVANAESYTMHGGAVVISAAGVLANDSDVDGGTLTPSVVSGVGHGSLTLNSDGSFSYTRTTGYSGDDSFTYRVSDGFFNSNTVTVTLSTPTMSVDVEPLSAVAGASTGSIVLATVTDTDTALTASGLTATVSWGDGTTSTPTAANGGIVHNTDGTFSIRAAHTYTAYGSCTLSVDVTDTVNNLSASPTATATVSNPVAVTNPGGQSSTEGDTVSLQVQGSHANGGTLSFSANGLPAGLSISSAGLISGTVSPGTATNVSSQVTVTATDGTYSASQSFAWSVYSPVRVLAVSNQSHTQGNRVGLQVQAVSATGAALTFSATGLPRGLSIDPVTGVIGGTVEAGDSADQTYQAAVTATDGTHSATRTFTWAVHSPVTLANPGTQSSAEGSSVSLQMQGTSATSAVLHYTAAGLPPGLAINFGTGVISGAVATGGAAAGSFSLTVTATDGSYFARRTFTWNVSGPITLTNPGDQAVAELDTVSLQVQASATAGGALRYAAFGLPPGLVINSTTGLISGTVAVGTAAAGPFLTTVVASNSASLARTTFRWEVGSLVVITDPGDQVDTEGSTVSLQIDASDTASGILSYAAVGLPEGLDIEATTGVVTGTIAAGTAAAGPYTVLVAVSNGTDTASLAFVWTVTSPVVITDPGEQTATEGETVSLQVEASGGGTLAYSVTGLPDGLAINASTGLISGTVAAGAALGGPYSTAVTVSDGTYTNSLTFTWDVASPVALAVVDDQDSTEGDSISLQIQATDSTNGTLTYSALGLPGGLTINASSGLISGTIQPGAAADGPYFTVVKTDNGTYSDSQFLFWNVHNPITLANPDSQSSAEGDTVSLQIQGTNTAGGTLSYSADGLPDGLSINASTGVIAGTITAGGSYRPTITVSNGTYSAQVTLRWQVSSPVQISSPGDQITLEGEEVSLQVRAYSSGSGTLSYSATGLPEGLAVDADTGMISGTIEAGAAQDGPYMATVTVTDGTHTSHLSFRWGVISPVGLFNPGDQGNHVGNAVLLPVWAADFHGGTLSFSATGLPDGLGIDTETGLISGTVTDDGTFAVTMTATDGTYTNAVEFQWVVDPAGPVVVTAPGGQTNDEGDVVSLQVEATNSASGTLTFFADELPAGLSIDRDTGLISGTVAVGAAGNGPLCVSVTATNGTDSDTQMFEWAVSSPIAVTNPGDQSSTEGDTVSLQVQASNSTSATLTFESVGLPVGLTIDRASGLISGTITSGAASRGPYTVEVTASDGIYTQSQTFKWEVGNPITITAVGDQENTEGDTVSLQVDADDSTNGTLTYSASGLPEGLIISASGGLISGTITAGAAYDGPYFSIVTATDGNYTARVAFIWTVNCPVVIGGLDDQSSDEGDTIELQVQASDSTSGTLTFSADGLPDGLSISETTGLISGSIAAGAAGPYLVTVTATDGTYSSDVFFEWTVSSPVALGGVPDQRSLEGDTVSLQIEATDAANGSVTYAASGLPVGLSIDASTGLISGSISAGGNYEVTVTASDGTYSDQLSFVWMVTGPITIGFPGDQASLEGDTVELEIQAIDAANGSLTFSASGLPNGLTVGTDTGLITGTISAGSSEDAPFLTTITATDGTSTQHLIFTWYVSSPVTVFSPGSRGGHVGDSVLLPIQAGDSHSGTLTFSASNLPDGLSIDSSTGLISGVLDADGTVSSTITASDGTYSDSRSFTWFVSEAGPVVITDPGSQTNEEGDSVSVQVQASLSGSGSLTYLADNLPAGLTISATTGLITGTIVPGAAVEGPYISTVIATDGTHLDRQTFLWSVSCPVVVTTPDDQESTEGDSVSLQMDVSNSNSSTLTFSALGLPSGLTINASTGLISGTVAIGAAASGPYQTTVTASDGTYSDSRTFTWAVINPVVVTSPDEQVNEEGDTVSLQVEASASTNGTLTYSASGLPDGLAIDMSTGLISGTITAGGAYQPTVTAGDGTYSDSRTFFWEVTSPVTIAEPGDQVSTEGDTIGLQIIAASTAGIVSYTAAGLPDGLTIDPDTGVISGTINPGAAEGGPHVVTLTATDGTHTEHLWFRWFVSSPVSIDSIDNQAFNVGDSVLLPIRASTIVAGTLSYSAADLPTGLSIDSSTGLISGTLTADGEFESSITSSDGTYSTSQSVHWTIHPAGLIVVTDPGSQDSTEGDTISLQVEASLSGSGALAYSAEELPEGLSIDPDSGIITGTIAPGAAPGGPYLSTVTATDGTHTDRQMFLWTVSNPIALTSPGDQTNEEGDEVSLAIEASDSLDGVLTYSAIGLPDGLTINTNTGLIFGTIAPGAVFDGPYFTTVTVTDGTYTNSLAFAWDVSSPVSVANPGNQDSVEGDTISLQVDAADTQSGATLTYLAEGLPDGLAIDPSTGLISGPIAPGAAARGPFTATISAWDGTYRADQAFIWNVSSPVVLTNPGDQAASEGDTISLQVGASTSQSATLLFSVDRLPFGLSINRQTGEILGTIATGAADYGPFVTTVTASDGTFRASQRFTWSISRPIALADPGDQVNVEGDSVSIQLVADDGSSATVFYFALGLPGGLTVNPGTGVISGTIADGAAAHGPYLVTVLATDGTYTDCRLLLWHVESPVRLTSPGYQHSEEGEAVSLQVTASDALSGTLTFSADGLPDGLSIDAQTGLISGTITAGAASWGPFETTLWVSDGSHWDSQTFSWAVTDPAAVSPDSGDPQPGSSGLQALARWLFSLTDYRAALATLASLSGTTLLANPEQAGGGSANPAQVDPLNTLRLDDHLFSYTLTTEPGPEEGSPPRRFLTLRPAGKFAIISPTDSGVIPEVRVYLGIANQTSKRFVIESIGNTVYIKLVFPKFEGDGEVTLQLELSDKVEDYLVADGDARRHTLTVTMPGRGDSFKVPTVTFFVADEATLVAGRRSRLHDLQADSGTSLSTRLLLETTLQRLNAAAELLPNLKGLITQVEKDLRDLKGDGDAELRRRALRLHNFLAENETAFVTLKDFAGRTYLPDAARDIRKRIVRVQELYVDALTAAYNPFTPVPGAMRWLDTVASELFEADPNLTPRDLPLRLAETRMQELPRFIANVYLGDDALGRMLGQLKSLPDDLQGLELRTKSNKRPGRRADELLGFPAAASQKGPVAFEKLDARRYAVRLLVQRNDPAMLSETFKLVGDAQVQVAMMVGLVALEQTYYWEELLAGHVVNLFDSTLDKVREYQKTLDRALTCFENAAEATTEAKRKELLQEGAETLAEVLGEKRYRGMGDEVESVVKTQKLVNTTAKLVAIVAAAAVTGGAAGGLAAGFAGGAGVASFVAEAVAFTVVSRIGHSLLLDDPQAPFLEDLAWNMAMLKVMKVAGSAFEARFRPLPGGSASAKALYGVGKVGTVMLTLHAFGELQHLVKNGRFMNGEERAQAVIQNAVLFVALEAGRALGKPLADRLLDPVKAKLKQFDAKTLEALKAEREAINKLVEKAERGELPEAEAEALPGRQRKLFAAEMDLLRRAYNEGKLTEQEYKQALEPYERQAKLLQLRAAQLGMELPGLGEGATFRTLGHSQVEYAPGAEKLLEQFYKERKGTFEDAKLPGAPKAKVGRLPSGETVFYFERGTAPKPRVSRRNLLLQSELGTAFRPITDPAERAWVDGFKADIAKGIKVLPEGRTSPFDPNSKITLSKRVGKVTPGDIHLLARDLGVEVAYVEESGKRFLYIGESPTRVQIGLHPNASRILHAQPYNPMPSPKDLTGFALTENPDAIFEIVTETVGSHRKYTVEFTREDLNSLAQFEGEALDQEILKKTFQKCLAQGINPAD